MRVFPATLIAIAGIAPCVDLTPARAATLQFTEVSAAAGVDVTNGVFGLFDHHDYTGGGAVADFNNDGWQDLFVISGGTGLQPDWLFINNGDGTFTDRAVESGLGYVHVGKGAAVGDFNNDGWVDLFLTSAGTFGRIGPGHHKLYRNNGDGTFTNIATSAGVNLSTPPEQGEDGFGATFGDYDLDGDLDLFVAGFADNNLGNRLYRNNGDETFTDVTDTIALFGGTPIQMRSFAPRLLDMDGDRYPELLLVSDFGTSRYFRNNTDGTFTDVTVTSNTSLEENGMGQTVGDFDNDGRVDWYVTSIYRPSTGWTGNKLYFNQGGHVYVETAAALGVDDGGYGWGAVGVDFDHDGRLDIAETNGGSFQSGEFYNEQAYLWIQNNQGAFDEMAVATGLSHFDRGRGMSHFDYDNDGDQDLVIFAYGDPIRLYRNDLSGPNRHWIRVLLDTAGQPGLPSGGVGAKVTVVAGGATQARWITSGDSFLSHSELSAHFGLKNASTVTELRVDWPDGSSTVLDDVTADRTLTVSAGPREQACGDAGDDDNDGLFDCDDPDCCGQLGCQNGEGICCQTANDCDDGAFCNGVESCIDDLCVAGPAPCPGQACDEGGTTCVECLNDADCDDGSFCNGVEVCGAGVCGAGSDPCAGGLCDDGLDGCVECLASIDCADDGEFCNGTEVCTLGVCESALDACPGRLCDDDLDVCIGTVELQPRAGRPLHRLTVSQLARFDTGREVFERAFGAGDGLGPIYNATSCAGCHTAGTGGPSATVTRFGEDDGNGGVDPLPGGPLLQTLSTSPSCMETLPPQADVVTSRLTTSVLGSGLVEAVSEGSLYIRVMAPPSGLSGRAQVVPVLEEPGEASVGRYGWKSQLATVRSMGAEELLDQVGVTNRLLDVEHAPNGDQGALALCDATPEPEDTPDPSGVDDLDRLTDYVRYLAPPPQTPRSGMTGATIFDQIGCAGCHVPAFFTDPNPLKELPFYFAFLYPYSDFLLHDMGDAGDPLERAGAMPGETRTAPLWGLRSRTTLWHDGRISGGTFASRVRAAIAEHDSPGSEAALSAQAFDSLSTSFEDKVIAFLDSLGRAEFDHDGDNDVDADDWVQHDACFTGPGSFYAPDDPCSISDVDQDGDVDADDQQMFVVAADAPAGRVPDSAAVAGAPLVVASLGGGQLRLTWDDSCSSADTDYAVYEGSIGSFDGHAPIACSTGGSTQHDFLPAAGATYYLVVPLTGFREGSYGTDSAGVERTPSSAACLQRAIGGCG